MAAIGALLLITSVAMASRGGNQEIALSPVERWAEIGRVIDGDTVTLASGERVRLVGINAPEAEEPGGARATAFLRSVLRSGTRVGLNVDDLRPRDRYGRTLAVVFVSLDGRLINLNAELLRSGLAEPLFVPPSEFNPYEWLRERAS